MQNGIPVSRTIRMRAAALALCLLTVGCLSSERKPFANNPLLLYYKPTLSDSATVLAEQGARRGPTQPPLPSFAKDVAPATPSLPGRETDTIKQVKNEVVIPDIQPVIRQSSAPSSATEEKRVMPAVRVQPETAMKTEFVVKSEPVEMPNEPAGSISITPSSGAVSRDRKSAPGNYSHNADYSSLQGVVLRLANGGCFLRYCDPSVEDVHGGKVRIENEAELSAFHDGDVVGVQGELHPEGARAGQTARFHVTSAWLVRQKQ